MKTLQELQDALADDFLNPDMPEELVDAELRSTGLDPDDVAARGVAFVEGLLAKNNRSNIVCAIVNDAGHVHDIAERKDAPPRASGVRHEIVQDGLHVLLREVWYWLDTCEERHADEVRMPINDLVHLCVNTTPGERYHISSVRTAAPQTDWADLK